MNIVEERDPQTYAIIGATMEIHRQLGHGFLEAVYQEAAVIEFALRQVLFEREVTLPIRYRDILLPTHYRADFVCFSEIIVEFKALSRLSSVEEAQLLNYLKATGLKRGLLINFGASSLQYKRLVWGYESLIHKSVQSV
ncbi:MAG: GxxExxY protein [Chloroflexi bacterium]|nr:MAG: GxxExxY protein [Chloroflexota bacterium]